MKTNKKKAIADGQSFGAMLAIGQLNELATELQTLRQAPPTVTRRPGHSEGDILGFVRGLRISARLAYFLRERLSSRSEFEVNWGHLLDANLASCSPECDIVIHKKGHHRRWNGGEQPIMDFRFILASSAKIVVSCKSSLTGIDTQYPSALRKFGVKHVFLFAECCKESRFDSLRKAARKAGYAGLHCLYVTTTDGVGIKKDEQVYVDFMASILKALGK